jgi:hypothetical protein
MIGLLQTDFRVEGILTELKETIWNLSQLLDYTLPEWGSKEQSTSN